MFKLWSDNRLQLVNLISDDIKPFFVTAFIF